MLPMPNNMFTDATFVPAVYPDDARAPDNGYSRPTYPGPGVAVRVSVQPKTQRTVNADGLAVVVQGFNVYFQASATQDPGALNGGKGVREWDRVLYRGRTLAAQEPAADPGDAGAAWKAFCVAAE